MKTICAAVWWERIDSSILQNTVAVFAIIGGAYAAIRVVGFVILWLRGPRVRLYIADRIWPVGHTDERGITLHIHFSLHNRGWRIGVLQRLEVTLATPERARYVIPWDIFLEPKPDGMIPKSPVYPVPLAPKEFSSLAVQCRAVIPEIEYTFDWPRGGYVIAIFGWINGRRRLLSPTGGYRFVIDGLAWGLLSHLLNRTPQPISHPVDVTNWKERRSAFQTIKFLARSLWRKLYASRGGSSEPA